MTDNELIANFMGLEFVTVGYTGGSDETEWQKENSDWFDSYYDFHDNSVGDYAVNVKRNIIMWQSDLNYKTDWNDLMDVVQKIYSLYDEFNFTTVAQENMFLDVLDSPIKYPIHVIYNDVVRFIKWYNQQKNDSPSS